MRYAALSIVALAAVAADALAPHAHGASTGTCEPAWSDDFRDVGFKNDVEDLAAFDGSVYAAGDLVYAGGTAVRGLARWDDVAWTAVDVGQSGAVNAVETIDDGNGPALYVAGADGAQSVGIWRVDDAGVTTLATGIGFGTGGNGVVRAFTWFDGKLYAAGLFDRIDDASFDNIACWDGTEWTRPGGAFDGLSADGSAYDLAVFDDGTGPALYAAGRFDGGVFRWDGTAWTMLVGGGAISNVECLAVHDDGSGGRLYAGGTFAPEDNGPVSRVAVWDGAAWTAVGGGAINWTVRDLASIAGPGGGGSALIAGGGGFGYGQLARWDGAAWTTLGIANNRFRTLLPVGSGADAVLFTGGGFERIEDVTALSVATWDGTAFADVKSADRGNGLIGRTNDFVVFKPAGARRADVYAGGSIARAAGERTCRIARYDGRRWHAMPDLDCAGRISALAVFDGDLYAGGSFQTIGNAPAGPIGAGNIARFDGERWTELDGGIAFPSVVNDMLAYADEAGERLVVAGAFESAGGVAVRNVAQWNGRAWAALGDGLAFEVNALDLYDDGTGAKLYAAGNGVSYRWTGTAWEDTGNPGGNVWSLATFDDGTGPALYGVTTTALRRFDGTAWMNVGATVDGTFLRVVQLDIEDTSYLCVGGNFSSIDGIPFRNVALWDGASWTDLAGGIGGWVTGLFVDAQSDALWFGGDFESAGSDDVVSINVARWGCPICLTDLSSDGSVGWQDLMFLLQSWGTCDGCREDLDEDGVVGFGDLITLLNAWGPC